MWRRAVLAARDSGVRAGAAGGAIIAAGSVAHAAAEPAETLTWGYGQLGQLGHGGEADQPLPRPVAQLAGADISFIASGSAAQSSAAVSSAGEVFTFGCGRDGRLGHGGGSDSVNQDVPKAVAGITGKAVAASCGEAHTLVLTSDNRVWSFGKARQGRLGRECPPHEGGTPGAVAVLGSQGARVLGVAAGRAHSAAWDDAGRLFVWGAGRDGALGLGSDKDAAAPTVVSGGVLAGQARRVASAACGRDHTLLLLDDGSVAAMGADDSGQCGTGQSARRHREPVWVRGLSGSGGARAVGVLAGDQHSVAVLEDGGVMAWGGNSSGQLATGDRADVGLPRRIDPALLGGLKVVDGAAGGSHTLLLTEDGSVWAVGRGRNGQLGRGDELESIAAFRLAPVRVASLGAEALGPGRSAARLAAGADHSMALVTDTRA